LLKFFRMYEEYWRLKEKPFKNTPDPKFFYYSPQHKEALARLRYCIEEGLGCALLSGVFGCGKTIVARTLQKQLSSPKYVHAFIRNPALSSVELLREIIWQLGKKVDLPHVKTDLLHILEDILLNNFYDGKETVIMIDEAHIIEDKEVLEELRMLLNFQTEEKFLLTLILIGQPEIRQRIANIKQLIQRIAMHFHLDKFPMEETVNYIKHRIEVAGGDYRIFGEDCFEEIYKVSGGIPRRINTVCDLALLTGYLRGEKFVNKDIIIEVGKEVQIL